MVHCFIIDDDPHAINSITSYLSKVPGITISGCFLNSLEAAKAIQQEPTIDLIFLDVQTLLISGFELAALVPSHAAIIFTSSNILHAKEAFDLQGIDFLMKPYPYNRFSLAVQKAMSVIRNQRTDNSSQCKRNEISIFLPTSNGVQLRQVHYADITHVQSLKNYVAIHFLNERIITYISMKEITSRLPSALFIRIHRRYLVNLSHIDLADTKNILLSTGIRLPMGDSYLDGFREKIKDQMLKSFRK